MTYLCNAICLNHPESLSTLYILAVVVVSNFQLYSVHSHILSLA